MRYRIGIFLITALETPMSKCLVGIRFTQTQLHFCSLVPLTEEFYFRVILNYNIRLHVSAECFCFCSFFPQKINSSDFWFWFWQVKTSEFVTPLTASESWKSVSLIKLVWLLRSQDKAQSKVCKERQIQTHVCFSLPGSEATRVINW